MTIEGENKNNHDELESYTLALGSEVLKGIMAQFMKSKIWFLTLTLILFSNLNRSVGLTKGKQSKKMNITYSKIVLFNSPK